MPITEQAHAKINLILDVTGKRPDGYHEIRTVFQSLSLQDTLIFSECSDGDVVLTSNRADLPAGAGNLAWQAADLLKKEYRITQGVHISLQKNIPVAAGLGGGSADAAAALRGLARFWDLPADRAKLLELAARLGSDVPFCLVGGTALGTGRGELLEPLPPCPHFYVVLANPGFPVSTMRVYSNLVPGQMQIRPDTDGMVRAIVHEDKKAVTERLANVLETSTFSLYPAVETLKNRMAQSGPALMCGSGATVFAVFSDEAAATSLCRDLLAEGTAAWMAETYNGNWGE